MQKSLLILPTQHVELQSSCSFLVTYQTVTYRAQKSCSFSISYETNETYLQKVAVKDFKEESEFSFE